MDDLELDRELQAVLGADPSPEFVARVRARIAQAPPPSLFAAWIAPAAAIACVVVVAGVALQRSNGSEFRYADLNSTPASNADATVGTTSTASAPPGAVPTFRSAESAVSNVRSAETRVSTVRPAEIIAPTFRSARMATTHTTAVEPPLPEVIVAPGDVEALRQFVDAATEARFVASFDPTPAPIPWVIPEPVDHHN